jgi:hypothetical protein
LLYRWQDLGAIRAAHASASGPRNTLAGVEACTWSFLKELYRAPDCESYPCDPAAVIARLRDAYAARSYAQYSTLFHDDFLFVLQPNPLDPTQPENWGRTEELRIHKRMFEPQNIGPGEDLLPLDLWLLAIDIELTSNRPFEERPEFYVSPANPGGLDPSRWKALGTEYNTSVLFQTQGELDYQVTGKAWFVVVQDLWKVPGKPGAFLLYQWQDLGNLEPGVVPWVASAGPVAVTSQRSTWSLLKNLYR